MVPPRYYMLLCLLFVFKVRMSCAFSKKVDVRNPRFNRTTVRHLNTGGNSIKTIHSSNRNTHIAGITNGKSVGIGGVLGAKESKAFGESLRKGLRKVLPFGNNIKQKSRASSAGNHVTRKATSIQSQTKQHDKNMRNSMSAGRIRAGVGNNANKINNAQRKFVGRPGSVTRVRLNKSVNGNGVGNGNVKSGGETRVQHLPRKTKAHTKMASANGAIQSQNTGRGSAAGTVRNNMNTVNSKSIQVRDQAVAVRGVSSTSRAVSSNSRVGTSGSSNIGTISSPGSTNGRGVAISTNNHNQNGKVWNSNGKSINGYVRSKISERNMGRNNGQFHRNSGQIIHHSARFNNRNSGRFKQGQNIMQRTSHRGGGGGGGGGNPSFHVSSGMQSNIRRRNGGIPRGISNSGKRVVVQNGRRIIVSPTRFSMHRRRFQSSQQQQQQQPRQHQVRIVGDPLEGGLENMDIDNIIGLASKIASVKLANSVLSSINEQEGTPQLSRFLINSELDIVPEVIVSAPRQVIQAPRRKVTINQRAPVVVQSKSPQMATNEIKVASSGYGTPVLVRSGGEIQFSQVDQNGKEISSVTISKGKQTNTVNNVNNVKINTKQGTGSQTGTGSGSGANGGTSKQAPERELETEMEQEGVSTTTTIVASTRTSKRLLPPTTTVANSVIVT